MTAAEPAAAGTTEVRNVNAKAARKLLEKNKEVVVIDVRSPGEFAEGHLQGARNVDFQGKEFEAALSKLDRQTPYLVHCAAGGRSTRALATFRKLGFKSVTHLDGGIGAWESAGYPVVK